MHAAFRMQYTATSIIPQAVPLAQGKQSEISNGVCKPPYWELVLRIPYAKTFFFSQPRPLNYKAGGAPSHRFTDLYPRIVVSTKLCGRLPSIHDPCFPVSISVSGARSSPWSAYRLRASDYHDPHLYPSNHIPFVIH